MMLTQKQKEVLLKDLCARFPYGVFVKEEIPSLLEEPVIYTYDYHPHITKCKPYLRPMSSITEEEKIEYNKLLDDCKEQDRVDYNITILDDSMLFFVIDWLNAKHFDYRGLISMGLALEAPEDMYKSK